MFQEPTCFETGGLEHGLSIVPISCVFDEYTVLQVLTQAYVHWTSELRSLEGNPR